MSTKKSMSTPFTASALRSLLTNGGDTPFKEITLPIESNGEAVKVFMRPLSAGAVVEFLTESAASVDADGKVVMSDPRRQSDAMLRLIARQVCDSEGAPVFDVADIDTLNTIPVTVFNVLRDHALGLITAGNEVGKAPSPDETVEPIVASPTV